MRVTTAWHRVRRCLARIRGGTKTHVSHGLRRDHLRNHEFDLGPDGLGKSISVGRQSRPCSAVLASNTNFSKDDSTLADLQRLAKEGVIPPLCRDRTWRNAFRHFRSTRQRRRSSTPVARCGDILRRHRDCQRDGEGSPRDREMDVVIALATAACRKARTGAIRR